MRAEGPVDWMVQVLIVSENEYVVMHLPDDMSEAEVMDVRGAVGEAWPGARVLFLQGGIEVMSIEMTEDLASNWQRRLRWLWKHRER